MSFKVPGTPVMFPAYDLNRAYRDTDVFVQAEDGIRDLYGTGVQTYALPISAARSRHRRLGRLRRQPVRGSPLGQARDRRHLLGPVPGRAAVGRAGPGPGRTRRDPGLPVARRARWYPAGGPALRLPCARRADAGTEQSAPGRR